MPNSFQHAKHVHRISPTMCHQSFALWRNAFRPALDVIEHDRHDWESRKVRKAVRNTQSAEDECSPEPGRFFSFELTRTNLKFKDVITE